jgi:hypothetical protein
MCSARRSCWCHILKHVHISIAGVSIGSVAFVGIVILLVYFFCIKSSSWYTRAVTKTTSSPTAIASSSPIQVEASPTAAGHVELTISPPVSPQPGSGGISPNTPANGNGNDGHYVPMLSPQP